MVHFLPGHNGYILHDHAQEFHGAGTGLLSIKTFFHGASFYTVGRRRYEVNDASYFILNAGQPYTITIESDRPVESLCLFFAPGFADATYHSLTTQVDRLLLEPTPHVSSALTFFERTYAHDHVLSPTIFQLRRALRQGVWEPGWLTEQFQLAMQKLLQVQRNIYRELESLPAVRASTREELYRRVHYAKDYADAMYATPITLTDMADVAGFSPNHLLRTFKTVFAQTPYQYLSAKRLEHARKLLVDTDRSVTDICSSLGFESIGAFGWMFHRRVGVSPLAYRRQNR